MTFDMTDTPTARTLEALRLYGHRHVADEADPRPLPETEALKGALGDMFDSLVTLLTDTGLEPDLDALLWSTVNLFHRQTLRLDRELDTNEQAQRQSQRAQDGSEIRSVELEILIDAGRALIARRDSYEDMRDLAADLFETQTGQAWRPRAGSHTHRRALTAALIDSRDFLQAKRKAEIEPLLPTGPRIAFAGGLDCTDHQAIWAALDRVHAKHADMVLLHGGAPRGADRIAACWAEDRGCPQIVFKPDWARHGKAAPFKRNDQLLDTLPIGLIVFAGSGITDNLADKARQMGVPLFDFRSGPCAST